MEIITTVVEIIFKLTIIIGSIWAIYKVKKYRENKQRIQMDIDASIYKLSTIERAQSLNWKEKDKKITRVAVEQNHTHAVEILLNFTNKGFTRMRLYNIQVGINTMREVNKAEFDEDNGHLHLTRIFTSGNVIPKFEVKNKPIDKTSFYYIEPGVMQTISYLALIPEPRELIQIYAKFSLEQKRIFPVRDQGIRKLFPHTVARTFQIDKNGFLIK